MRWDEVPPGQRIPREDLVRWMPGWVDRLDHPELFCPIAVRPFPSEAGYLPCGAATEGRVCYRHAPGWSPPRRQLPPHQFDTEVKAARERWGLLADPASYTDRAERYQVEVLRRLIDSLQLDTSGSS
jgi:hypothetical protein